MEGMQFQRINISIYYRLWCCASNPDASQFNLLKNIYFKSRFGLGLLVRKLLMACGVSLVLSSTRHMHRHGLK